MKNRKTVYKFSCAAILLVVAVIANSTIRRTAATDRFVLDISTESSRYSLGEAINVNFALTNLTGESAEVSPPNVFSGSLKLYISSDGGRSYRRYYGPMWAGAKIKRCVRVLRDGESLTSTAKVQYNQVPSISNLAPMYADEIKNERLMDNWALTEPGEYTMLAVFATDRVRVESLPVTITVEAPSGPDAVVWDQIKRSRQFAYFLDTGDLRDLPDSPEGQEFLREVENLIREIPDSRLTREMAANLSEYQNMLAELERARAK